MKKQFIYKVLLVLITCFVSSALFAQGPAEPPTCIPLDSEIFLPIILATGFVAFLVRRRKK